MARKPRNNADDLRGASQLVVDATKNVTTVVEEMHRTIGSGPAVLGRPLEGPMALATGVVYGSIRGVTGLVGSSIDHILAQLVPLLGNSTPSAEQESLLAVLNGVVGDHLAHTHNPLALEIRLRHGGEDLDLEDPEAMRSASPEARGRVLLMAHGSCMNDAQWRRNGQDHGATLAQALDATPVYLLYNSGLHVSENGEALAELLEQLVTSWPVPVEELIIVAHSMGGLVARSACHAAETRELAWRGLLRTMVFLGTPHHGAPMERWGNWFETRLRMSSISAPLARLARLRSAGVTDLRFGNVLEEHWRGHDRFDPETDRRSPVPLPEGVACYAVAGELSGGTMGRQRGDGMVNVDSALGIHEDPAKTLVIPEDHRLVVPGAAHVDLLGREDVAQALVSWLTAG